MTTTTQCIQTSVLAQSQEPNHNGVVNMKPPCNSVVPMFTGQGNQTFEQGANFAQQGVSEPIVTRVRLVMHDACVLWVKNNDKANDFSLAAQMLNQQASEEVYFWKRDQGGFSNV